jgi:hypothetical protein
LNWDQSEEFWIWYSFIVFENVKSLEGENVCVQGKLTKLDVNMKLDKYPM